MRAVLQRVTRASVVVDGEVVGAINKPGIMALSENWTTLRRLKDRILARHPDLRIVRATKQDLAATLKDVNAFGNRVRETVWGFTPITPAELDFLTHRIMRVMIPDLVLTCAAATSWSAT